MKFIKWINLGDKGLDTFINVDRIPLYHFPDVWQNVLFISGFFKIILGIMILISITNEFSYRTIRQNIIDGMSRLDFLKSKILTNLVLSLASLIVVSVIALFMGLIYSPSIDFNYFFDDVNFFLSYFLEVFSYLSYALLIGILVKRAGLAILILLFSRTIELIIKLNVPEQMNWAIDFFPMESMTNLIPVPFLKYILQEIQDYVKISTLLIAVAWMLLFNFFSFRILKRSDI
jgi:ABC-2 type transport system permease protein